MANGTDAGAQAVLVLDSGSAEANGVYQASASHNGAQLYRQRGNTAYCLRREVAVTKGRSRNGWVLSFSSWRGEEGDESTASCIDKILYGIGPSESLLVPGGKWRCFEGQAPPPSVQTYEKAADAYLALSQKCCAEAVEAQRAEDWSLSLHCCSQGLLSLHCSALRFGDDYEALAAQLLAVRARGQLQLRDFRAALRDSVASLELKSEGEGVKALALEAATALGCGEAGDVHKLLEAAGKGQILDRCAPLALQAVERWIDAVLKWVAARKASTAAVSSTDVQSNTDVPEEKQRCSQEAPGSASVTDQVASAASCRCANEVEAQADAVELPQQVTEDFHEGFLAWIGFSSGDVFEADMPLHEWQQWMASQLSAMNWRLIARRCVPSNVSTANSRAGLDESRASTVRLLAVAYVAAGTPGRRIPAAARELCDAELRLHDLALSVSDLTHR